MSLLGLVLAHLNSNWQKSLCVMNVSFAVIVFLCLFRCAVSGQRKGFISDTSCLQGSGEKRGACTRNIPQPCHLKFSCLAHIVELEMSEREGERSWCREGI